MHDFGWRSVVSRPLSARQFPPPLNPIIVLSLAWFIALLLYGASTASRSHEFSRAASGMVCRLPFCRAGYLCFRPVARDLPSTIARDRHEFRAHGQDAAGYTVRDRFADAVFGLRKFHRTGNADPVRRQAASTGERRTTAHDGRQRRKTPPGMSICWSCP